MTPFIVLGGIKDDIPPKAFLYFNILNIETNKILPDLKYPEYFGGLIEHESCISLTHSKCWDPRSELKTKREQGVGLGQTTRAFNNDGSTRFDTLLDLRRRHYSELKELSWTNIKVRPDLQIRAILLMSKNNYKALKVITDPYQRLAIADAAYNGGLGGVNKERKVCGLARGCDPQIWFGNIERYCSKSNKALYGNRSACDINRHHVLDVLTIRMSKYTPYLHP